MKEKTRALNLDSMFVPIALPEIEFTLSKFNGGEISVRLNTNIDYDNVDRVVITHRVNNMDDFMEILLVKNALEIYGVRKFDLIMPYVPYARQDRVCNDGESFSLKVFTDLLNSANFDKVHIYDAHSEVAPALINNCVNHNNHRFVSDVLCDFVDKPLLISPDAGASKKATLLAIKYRLDIVKCDKVRNLSDGSLSGFDVFTTDLFGQDCLIVDDICDGGGTFLGLAKELKAKGAGSISLLVTHGIFSRGFSVFDGLIDNLYCSNSVKDFISPQINQINIYA